MPWWIFAKDSRGTYHQMGGHFASEIMAQEWVDSHLEGNEDPELFHSPSYDSARVTQQWKFKRIEKEGLDAGTKRIRHDKPGGG